MSPPGHWPSGESLEGVAMLLGKFYRRLYALRLRAGARSRERGSTWSSASGVGRRFAVDSPAASGLPECSATAAPSARPRLRRASDRAEVQWPHPRRRGPPALPFRSSNAGAARVAEAIATSALGAAP